MFFPLSALAVLHQHLVFLDKYAETKDARFITRTLRYVNHLRARLSNDELKRAIETYVLDSKRSAAVLDIFAAVAGARGSASKVRFRGIASLLLAELRTPLFVLRVMQTGQRSACD
jgi:hypothetical protein